MRPHSVDYQHKFPTRPELVAYFIAALTNVPFDQCENEAGKYEHKPFFVRHTED